MFAEYLQECIDYYGAHILSFDDVSYFLSEGFSPIGSLFGFCRCMPFVFLCVCLSVVGILSLIKKIFFAKNYI